MQKPDLILPERKEHNVNYLQELVISCDQKKEMYNDIIYHCTEMMEGQIPSSDILPKKDDILRYIKFQRRKPKPKEYIIKDCWKLCKHCTQLKTTMRRVMKIYAVVTQ
jgi:hypothetical protein